MGIFMVHGSIHKEHICCKLCLLLLTVRAQRVFFFFFGIDYCALRGAEPHVALQALSPVKTGTEKI